MLDVAEVLNHASPTAKAAGATLMGQVQGLRVSGDLYQAVVLSSPDGERVQVISDGHYVPYCVCTCPAPSGAICEHAVAVVLAAEAAERELIRTGERVPLALDMDPDALLRWSAQVGDAGLTSMTTAQILSEQEHYERHLSGQSVVRVICHSNAAKPFERKALLQRLQSFDTRYLELRARDGSRQRARRPPEDELAPAWHFAAALRRTLAPYSVPAVPSAQTTPITAVETDPLRIKVCVQTSPYVQQWDQSAVIEPGDLNRGTPRVLCKCHPGRENYPCPSTLSALDIWLDLLEGSYPDARSTIERELRTPPWTRLLEDLDAVTALQSPELTVQGRPATLGWELTTEPNGSTVTPILFRPKARGEGFVFKRRLKVDALADTNLTQWEHETLLMCQASLVGPAPSTLLRRLVGKPHLFVGDTPCELTAAAIEVHTAPSASGDVECHFRVGEQRWSVADYQQRFQPRSGRPIQALLISADDRVLLVETNATVRRLAQVLQKRGSQITQSGSPQLMGRLAALSDKVTVQLDDGLKGNAIAPSTDCIVRLSFRSTRALDVALRAQPLPERAAVVPGVGADEMYALRDGKAVHCRRDRRAEWDAAVTVCEQLGLPRDPLSLDAVWTITETDDALALVDRLQAHEIPAEWDTESRLHVERPATAADLTVRVGQGRKWFAIGGTVQIDGRTTRLRDLLATIREGRQFVALSADRWARVDDELRRALEAAAQLAATHSAHDELPAVAAPLLEPLRHAGATFDVPAAWARRAEAMEEATRSLPAVPATLHAELRPYQLAGYRWLRRLASWAPGAVLADDMGLGKTVQALTLLLTRAADGSALVVAPTSLGFNWAKEARRFAPGLRVRRFRGKGELDELVDLGPGDLLITSYDLVARYRDRLERIDWHTVVLDEAHAIKNPQTQRSKAVAALGGHFTLALTGTPVENRAGELWSLFRSVVPGYLGPRDHFRERFERPIEGGSARAKRALAALVRPFILRRLKRDVAQELPKRSDVRLDIELSRLERSLYDELRESTIAALTHDEHKDSRIQFRILAALTRLRQMACDVGLVYPERNVPSSKLRVLVELISDLRSEGHRALVFSQFTALLRRIAKTLDEHEITYRYLDGSVRPAAREAEVDAFQAGSGDVFLLSLKAGGTGLNLTGADYVIHVDPWWNPAVEDQATDRAHRIGQHRPVTVYRLVSRGTVEEMIYAMHSDKRELTDTLLAGTDSANALSPQDLMALLSNPRTTAVH